MVIKIKSQHYDLSKIEKFCKDSSLNSEETQAVIAVLNLIIESFIKYSVEDSDFLKEMLQLGLSQEIAESMLSAINKDKSSLIAELKKSTLRVNKITKYDYTIKYEHDEHEGRFKADLQLKTEKESINFTVGKEKLKELLFEMQKVEDAINKL